MSTAAALQLHGDRELQARIALALALVVLLPFAFVYAALFLLNTVGIAMLEWIDGQARHGQYYVDPVVLTVVVLGGLLVQYRYGPRMVLDSVGARQADGRSHADLEATVTRLAAQADLPTPAVAVIHTELPNAFAVGTARRSTIAVTTGLLELLDDAELEAVLAHELAHVANRDASVMTTAWLLPTLTYYLAIGSYTILYGLFRILGTGTAGRSRGGDGRGLAVVIVVITVSAALTLAVSVVFWAGSVLLYRILARYREYAADRGAVAITGDPAALANALAAVDETMPSVPDRDLRRYDGGAEALYLAPLESRAFDGNALLSTDVFPDTHPPTAARIDRLRELAREQA